MIGTISKITEAARKDGSPYRLVASPAFEGVAVPCWDAAISMEVGKVYDITVVQTEKDGKTYKKISRAAPVTTAPVATSQPPIAVPVKPAFVPESPEKQKSIERMNALSNIAQVLSYNPKAVPPIIVSAFWRWVGQPLGLDGDAVILEAIKMGGKIVGEEVK